MRSTFSFSRLCCRFLFSYFSINIYRSQLLGAIAQPLRLCTRVFRMARQCRFSPFLTRLFRSFFLKRPPSRSLVPSWSLSAVLRVLAEAPFEPLQKVSLFFFQSRQWSCSLLPRQRCSSIHAISVEPGQPRWENYGVRLIPSVPF